MSSDGSRVAIGAPNNDGNGSDAGHVRVYALPSSCEVTWYNEQGDPVGTGEVFDPVAANAVDPGVPGNYSFYPECTCADGCANRHP